VNDCWVFDQKEEERQKAKSKKIRSIQKKGKERYMVKLRMPNFAREGVPKEATIKN